MASITNKVNTKVEVANEIKSFIGGMNTYATDDKLSDNEVRLIQNMELDNYGTAEKRVGLVFDSSKDFAFKDTDVNAITNISSIQGVFDFVEIIDGASVNIKIVIIGGKVYRKASNTTYSLLYPYLFDEITQKYSAANTSIDYYVNGFHNGKSTTATTFQANDCRPVTATYSKGVLLIATGWKLLEYGLFDNSDITGSGSTTKSYYLRQVKPRLTSTAQSDLYGSNLLSSLYSQTYDNEDNIKENTILSSNSHPQIKNIKYSVMLLKFNGTPTSGYSQYTACLVVEPIVSVGSLFEYQNPLGEESGYFTSSDVFVGLTEDTLSSFITPTNENLIFNQLTETPTQLNSYRIISDNLISVQNTKWFYAKKPNGDIFTNDDFNKYIPFFDVDTQYYNSNRFVLSLDTEPTSRMFWLFFKTGTKIDNNFKLAFTYEYNGNVYGYEPYLYYDITSINFSTKLDELLLNSGFKDYINKCNLIMNYNNGIFLAGNTTDTNTYYQCYTDDYNYFPSTYVDAILGTYTTTITDMKSYRSGFLIFTDREIYYRTNVNPEQRNLKILNNTVGCISNFGSANIGNDCVFLSYDGLYRLYLTYGTISDNFNVKKIDLKISNLISKYIPTSFNQYSLTQPFVTRCKNYVYILFPNSPTTNKTIIFKYNEITEAWTTDLIEACGNVLRITDKNTYIEYICSKKYVVAGVTKEFAKSYTQYTKERIEILENQALVLSPPKVLDKNIFYSDDGDINTTTMTGNKGTAYTSVVETANHKFDPYGNWFKKYYRWLINLNQDKKYYSKIYLTVFVDDVAILKPTNFTTTYDKVTNTVIYNQNNENVVSYVYDKTLGKYVEASSEIYNEAVLTLRNNVIPLPTDDLQMTTTEGEAGIIPITIVDDGAETHLTDNINNYGGHFDISAYEVPNIDKFVANINESGITTRIRIEQTETQYFGVTSLAYIFKFDTDFKNW